MTTTRGVRSASHDQRRTIRASVGPMTPHVTSTAASAPSGPAAIAWPRSASERATSRPSPRFWAQPNDST